MAEIKSKVSEAMRLAEGPQDKRESCFQKNMQRNKKLSEKRPWEQKKLKIS